MKLYSLLLLSLLLSCISFSACKKEGGLKHGSVAPVNSIQAFAGRNRVKITWHLPADAAVKSCVISWNNGSDSVIVPAGSGTGTMSKVIDGLKEENYYFTVYAVDNKGNTSGKTAIEKRVYGDQYEDSLQNRPIRSVNAPFAGDHTPVITWNDAAPGTVRSEVRYAGASGMIHVAETPQYENKTVLKDYKAGGLLEYRTLYLPEINAIDTFYSAYQKITLDVLPDYSFAGYERDKQAIPLVPVKETVSPGPGDDGQRIQDAIDAVAGQPLVDGFRGAVLLKAGNYEVEQPLMITASGIVLRGEGQGDNGTVITATGTTQYNFIQVKGSGSDIESSRSPIVANDVRVGATKIPVQNAGLFQVGDTVMVRKTPNDHWIDTLQMAQYGWTASGYRIAHRRIIRKITGDTIEVGIPMVDFFTERFGGGYVAKVSSPGRIAHCGVENLRLLSAYKSDDDEQHGWVAVSLTRAVNSWVRNVTAVYFGYACAGIYQSDFNTVQDCAMLDPKSITTGGRKYSFYIDKGLGNLFQRCYTRGGRHDFVTGSRVTGPNVFLDCYATQTHADIGPHHRWSTGILFDNISGGQINVQNRGSYGSGHGWVGAQVMLWNCHASSIILQSPQIGANWAVGCAGGSITGKGPYDNREGYVESWGTPVQPRSLFLNQLKKRLGEDAVERITTPAQRSGSIWDALRQWAGSGTPLKTIQ